MTKIFIIYASLIWGFAGIISAQKPEEHKKSSYVDSLGRLVVQLDMPVYLFVSTSLDETPTRLVRNDAPGNDPIYLDGPGQHFIRHQDYINHRAEVFPIWADGQAPTTTISFLGTPQYVINEDTWFGHNTNVVLRATDDIAGVKQIYYSTDDVNFAPYNQINIEKEGNFKLSYYAVDNVGNVESVKQREFFVDLTPPVTSHHIEGMYDNDIILKDAKITLTSSDNLSGVERIMYRFNNEPEKVYRPGTTISFAHLPDGMQTLYYYAEDRVKNKEAEKSVSFFNDKAPPIISADVLGDVFIVDNREYFSGRTKLKLTAVDNKSGVKEVRYSINNEPFVEYEDPFYLPSITGRHTIRYYATDNLGNTSQGDYTHNSGIVYVDLTGPVLSYEISGPKFQKGDMMFISPETKLILSGVDRESGLQYISYSIGRQPDETRYEGPFSINESGTHDIRFFGYDNVNNRNTGSFEVTVDADGPEIFSTFSVARIDEENPEDIPTYPSYVLLYLAATDLLTGNAEIFYSINNERETQYTAPIRRFSKNASYTVVVRAKDQLGNFSEKTVTFNTGDY